MLLLRVLLTKFEGSHLLFFSLLSACFVIIVGHSLEINALQGRTKSERTAGRVSYTMIYVICGPNHARIDERAFIVLQPVQGLYSIRP